MTNTQQELKVTPRMKPVPKNHIVESEELIGQEIYLYDYWGGAVHTLNSGAAMVWLLCDGVRDLEEVAREMAAASSLSAEEVLPQVLETVTQFQSAGLLKE